MKFKILTFIDVNFLKNRKQNTLVIGTHNGIFHADEVVAIAILCLHYKDYEIIIVRTRDENVLALCDICVDVGEGKYDHHQRGFDSYRDNNVLYASAGLVWRDFGEKLIKKYLEENFPKMSDYFSFEIWKDFDEKFIIPVDIEDNGKNAIKKEKSDVETKAETNIKMDKKYTEEEVNKRKEHCFSYITSFRPLWNDENQNFEEQFLEVLNVTCSILKHQLLNLIGGSYGVDDFLRARCKDDKYFFDNILEIPSQTTPWLKSVIDINNMAVTEKEIINFVIFKYPDGGWAAQCVPPSLERENEERISFPKEWAGQTTLALAKICGVPGAIRCHNNRFFIRAETRKAVVQMCRLATASASKEN